MREALNDHQVAVFDANEQRQLSGRLTRSDLEEGDLCFIRMPGRKNKETFEPGSS